MTPILTYLLCTYDGSPWSRLVVRVTGRRLPDRSDAWSHVGLAFSGTQEDAPHAITYFENLLSTGFRGPYPIQRVYDWVARSPRRRFALYLLPISTPHAHRVHSRCTAWSGVIRRGYNPFQLLAIWASIRFGCSIPRSPTRGICSEDVARLCHPELDLREPGQSFDAADPNSVYRRALQIRASGCSNASPSLHPSPLHPSPLQPASLQPASLQLESPTP